jgi:hypothetical protein
MNNNKKYDFIRNPHNMEAQRTLGTSASNTVAAIIMNNIARVVNYIVKNLPPQFFSVFTKKVTIPRTNLDEFRACLCLLLLSEP